MSTVQAGKQAGTKSARRVFWEYLEAILTALVLALIIRAYVVQAFKIPSGSMKPTLVVGDHLLVNKFLYGTVIPFTHKRVLVIRPPERGDVIVFKFPKDPSRDFIKRVIGVPGDIVFERDKVVYINGKRTNDSFTQHVEPGDMPASSGDPRDNFGPVRVPQGEFFVMGDNRDRSYDSRYWGFVPYDDIQGKAFIIYWSWDGDWHHAPLFKRMGELVKSVRLD
ncbi:MAG: signal peptidase I [Nitrospiraceae bacterium]|nr:signal peptidase I [Nitrospiraceae bacterium]